MLELEFVLYLFIMHHLTFFFLAARQAPPPAPVRDGGGSILGGIGSTIAQGRYSKLVLFRIASDINIIVILELI
jgi:hypothetical protein